MTGRKTRLWSTAAGYDSRDCLSVAHKFGGERAMVGTFTALRNRGLVLSLALFVAALAALAACLLLAGCADIPSDPFSAQLSSNYQFPGPDNSGP